MDREWTFILAGGARVAGLLFLAFHHMQPLREAARLPFTRDVARVSIGIESGPTRDSNTFFGPGKERARDRMEFKGGRSAGRIRRGGRAQPDWNRGVTSSFVFAIR